MCCLVAVSSAHSWRSDKQLRAPLCDSIPPCHRCSICALPDRAPLKQDLDLSLVTSLGAQHRVTHTQQHSPLVQASRAVRQACNQPPVGRSVVASLGGGGRIGVRREDRGEDARSGARWWTELNSGGGGLGFAEERRCLPWMLAGVYVRVYREEVT